MPSRTGSSVARGPTRTMLEIKSRAVAETEGGQPTDGVGSRWGNGMVPCFSGGELQRTGVFPGILAGRSGIGIGIGISTKKTIGSDPRRRGGMVPLAGRQRRVTGRCPRGQSESRCSMDDDGVLGLTLQPSALFSVPRSAFSCTRTACSYPSP